MTDSPDRPAPNQPKSTPQPKRKPWPVAGVLWLLGLALSITAGLAAVLASAYVNDGWVGVLKALGWGVGVIALIALIVYIRSVTRKGRPATKEGREAERTHVQEEVDRLLALPTADLALAVLPAVATLSAGVLTGIYVQDIVKQLLGFVPMSVNSGVLLRPVRDALQRLEHANLVILTSDDNGATRSRITRDGEQALADGTVAVALGLAGVTLETILASVGQPAAERLRQLDTLRYQHLVSDAEFEEAKSKILGIPS